MPRSVRRLTLALAALAVATLAAPPARAQQQPAAARKAAAADQADPFIWLEDVEAARSMAWVKSHNEATMSSLGADARYTALRDRIRSILDSKERIAYPQMRGADVYNFWKDAGHPRGIWRRATYDSYVAGSPAWRTVLDIDSLSAADKQQWAWGGSSCLPPAWRRCLVRLSRGGADAVQVREFDTETGRFVEGGFALPEAKQDVEWVSENAVLVDTDFGAGSLTTSGYPRIAKLWRRGTPLSAAKTLIEGQTTDVGVGVGSIENGDSLIGVVSRSPSFFETAVYILRGDSLVKLDLPLDTGPTILGDQLVVYVRTPWTVGGKTYPTGSLIATSLNGFLAGQRDFTIILAPTDRQTVDGTTPTRDYLLVELLDNVRARLLRLRHEGSTWHTDTIPVPDYGNASVVATSARSNRFFFTYAGFTQPNTLYLADEDGSLKEIKRLPALFDATGLVTEQHEATSKDGTRVPYFVVHRATVALDGNNPTLLYGYGGFEISLTPSYSSVTGAAWLEQGGVYVLANIRGGGEFGPAWHRAALKENRQRAYDDFIAVAEDLVAKKITTPQHLGIMGGSNGGLLMGVMLTERPDLWGAVAILNPLLDMKRFNHLLAGASWMGEYGDPDIPEQWAYISKYSAYQNLKSGVKYPRPFIATTTRDDRVHPGHARKFAARMEGLGDPIYFFENTEGGHGSGVTSEQQAREQALVYVYLWKQLGSSATHP